jgi:hypothetical protein
MRRHTTVSAWQREHDGSYQAEMHGWKLRVTWKQETPRERRGFRWQAERAALGLAVQNAEVHEEIELAMLEAEQFAETASLATPPAAA